MTSLETVYAVHNFEAENNDELTFQIGEPIIIIQKDDGFNDGWWKGQNMSGEIGIFPMNYITFDPPASQLVDLPTPSNSDSVTRKPSHINTSVMKDRFEMSPSVRQSYSFTCPISSSPACHSANSNSNNNSPLSNNSLRRIIINALFLPHLRSTAPRDWDVDQVETWLNAMSFGSLGEHFKSQEITGDILLELNMESLKELDVPTFGKRFKLHSAIIALREECGMQSPGRNRLSSSYSDDQRFHHQRSPSHSPSSARYSSPMYNKNSFSYHSNLTSADKYHQSRKSYHSSIKESCDEVVDQKSPARTPPTISPITPSSTYDIMEANKQNYENRQYEQVPSSSSKRDMAFLQQTQKQQTVLPMARRSSMDLYNGRQDDNANVTPDMEGWLYKQGCKYKKWNKRWFVLKGPNLFYFKSPKDVRMKGIINLRGYRIIPDETIQPGKYSFKAQHEEERTFNFYTDLDTSMKAWISSLMKATISRDFTAPVLSSSMIPTVSLDVARRMRPRPPSVLLYKKEKKDLGYQTPISEKSSSSSTTRSQNESTKEDPLNQDSGFDSNDQEEEEVGEDIVFSSQQAEEDEDEGVVEGEEEEDEEEEEEYMDEEPQEASWTASDYIQWINTISSSANITRLQELRQGDVLIEILEELSGKPVRQLPTSTVGSISMLMLDNIVAVFKFMSVEGIEIGDKFTIKDIYGGNEEKIELMLESILKWSVRLNDGYE